MFKLGGCLFAFIFLIFFFLLSLVIGALNILFGFRRKTFGDRQSRRTFTYGRQEPNNQGNSRQQEPHIQESQYQKQEKIIPKNEGEYVDFEEVR